jgi:hypothetical protein
VPGFPASRRGIAQLCGRRLWKGCSGIRHPDLALPVTMPPGRERAKPDPNVCGFTNRQLISHSLSILPGSFACWQSLSLNVRLLNSLAGPGSSNFRKSVSVGNLFGCKSLKGLERETGIEPATSSLGSWHSTAELLPLV